MYQRHMLQGGGEVQLSVPTVRMLPPVSLLQEGMVKRVRGVAHSMRVSPQSSNRMVGAWPSFVVTCWRAAAEPPARLHQHRCRAWQFFVYYDCPVHPRTYRAQKLEA